MRSVLFLLLLLPVMTAGAQGSDPAYVDDPGNKSAGDPARADGGEGNRTASSSHDGGGDHEMDAAEAARTEQEAIARMQRITEAQMAAVQKGMAAANAANAANMSNAEPEGPPIGGTNLLAQLDSSYAQRNKDLSAPMPQQMPQATPGQQIGSALIQDAAGVADANLNRNRFKISTYP